MPSGFIFLVTQMFQFLKGYGPLSTGVRLLPVASFVAISSILGARLAVRLGTKLVVASGLFSMAAFYLWVSTSSVTTGFELAGRGQPGAANIDSAPERNRAFAATDGHQGAVVFPKLRLFVITCLDPRVDPAPSSASASATRWSSATSAGGSPRRSSTIVAFIGQFAETVLLDGQLFEVTVIHRNPTSQTARPRPGNGPEAQCHDPAHSHADRRADGRERPLRPFLGVAASRNGNVYCDGGAARPRWGRPHRMQEPQPGESSGGCRSSEPNHQA